MNYQQEHSIGLIVQCKYDSCVAHPHRSDILMQLDLQLQNELSTKD